jgi:osmotically-inducible protein OsmY
MEWLMAIPQEIEETDKGIADGIAKILQAQTEVPADSIKAGVHKGVVTLTGEVDDEFERLDVEKQIEDVKGIKFIENDITIRKHGMAADGK